MTSGDANDPMLRALGRLPAAAPNEARETRVRARCHAALERARRRRERPARGSTALQIIEAAFVGGLCLLYLSAVLREVSRLVAVR
jgi:hypothetical protein